MENTSRSSRVRRTVGAILIFLPGLAVMMSELTKFARVPTVVNSMAAAGFSGGKITLVASLGLSSALLFLFPRTRSVGVLLLSSFLGGAVCLHVQRGEYANALAPALLLALAWIGTFLRHPALLWSLRASDWDSPSYSEGGTRNLASDDAR